MVGSGKGAAAWGGRFTMTDFPSVEEKRAEQWPAF
jgi:hypothetical protein